MTEKTEVILWPHVVLATVSGLLIATMEGIALPASARPVAQGSNRTRAHEIGHSLGLRHISRSNTIMKANDTISNRSAFYILTPDG